jgi:hypothetical protein
LIKVNTTKDQGTAIAIPGQVDPALARFEEQFFNELANQHDRVDLFVKSKADEIDRRLRKWTKPLSRIEIDQKQNSYTKRFTDYLRDALSTMASEFPASDRIVSENMIRR